MREEGAWPDAERKVEVFFWLVQDAQGPLVRILREKAKKRGQFSWARTSNEREAAFPQFIMNGKQSGLENGKTRAGKEAPKECSFALAKPEFIAYPSSLRIWFPWLFERCSEAAAVLLKLEKPEIL
jgi:hypothetical protein